MLGAGHVANDKKSVTVDKEHCLGAVSFARRLFLQFIGCLDRAVGL